MKLRKRISFRGVTGKINYYLTIYLLIITVLGKIYSETFIISLIPASIIGAIIVFFNSKNTIFLENSYLYFKKNSLKPNPLEDIPIKSEAILSYNINEIFPKISRWCNSSDNIILFLKSGKNVIFSVKEKIIILEWLKQNGICKNSRKTYKGKIEVIIFILISLYETMYRLFKHDTFFEKSFLIISACCFLFWFYYICSGLYLIFQKDVKD